MGAGVLFLCQGSMLILQRNKSDDRWAGYWNLPGGSSEPQETHYETALREIQEEIGTPPSGFYFFGEHSTKAYTVYYAISPYCFKPRLNAEHCAYRWVPLSEIFSYRLHPREKNALIYFLHR